MVRLTAAAIGFAAFFAAVPALAQDGDVPAGRTFICDEGNGSLPYTMVVVPKDPFADAALMLSSEMINMPSVPVEAGYGWEAVLPLGQFFAFGEGNELYLAYESEEIRTCYRD